MRPFRFTLPLLLFLAVTVHAHPVPRRIYERTVTVQLTETALIVEYQVELGFATALEDLKDEEDFVELITPEKIGNAYARAYARVLANNMTAQLGKKPLIFKPDEEKRIETVDSVRCTFTFRANWPLKLGETYQLQFHDFNYENEPGWIRLSATGDETIQFTNKSQPDEAVILRQTNDLRPGENDLLRAVDATFQVTPLHLQAQSAGLVAAASLTPLPALSLLQVLPEPPPMKEETEAPPTEVQRNDLLALLLDPHRGFWVLLLLACFFGAVHALTPGHGKTLVAAYLVGERGTVWHALFLGLVTTLTHTGAVLILAAVLPFFLPDAPPARVQFVLGFGGGLLVAGMGTWLLFRRLSGQVDHVHLGGHGHHHHHLHHHHHHHGAADHYHDEHGHVHALPEAARRVGWWGLVVLGVSGGIVPCWDAILMFGFAVATHRLWLGLPLLLAFSAGLAGVLIVIGILVVKAKGFAGSHFGESRLFRMLPVASAAMVTCLGLWLCYSSVHP
jgi:ABC-type nickel/cobalt efflux system permease component RcnA